MCTETFLRLPEEKRNRFLEAAWEEFTTVPFSRASINQIIRRAGIPRGSFYQYFTDKSDLFTYLMEDVRDRMLEIFHGLLKEGEGDLFRVVLLCYDRFQQYRDRLPFLDRYIDVLRINPKIDLENMLIGQPEDYIKGEFLREINLPALRRRDDAYVIRICRLTGMSLASVLAETLYHPEDIEICRQDLIGMLEIIQRGCLRETGGAEADRDGYGENGFRRIYPERARRQEIALDRGRQNAAMERGRVLQ